MKLIWKDDHIASSSSLCQVVFYRKPVLINSLPEIHKIHLYAEILIKYNK